MTNYLNQWGLFPWFLEDGANHIHPEDMERLQELSPYSKVFHCIEEKDGYLILAYSKNKYRVKPELFEPIETDIKFDFFDRVRPVNHPEMEGVIIDIIWHFKDKSPMYYISVNGKNKSKRYSEKDLLKIN